MTICLFARKSVLALALILPAGLAGAQTATDAPTAPVAVKTDTPAPDCPATKALDAQQPQIDKVLGLAKEGLVDSSTVYSVYDTAAEEMQAAGKNAPYDIACLAAAGTRIAGIDAADGDDISHAGLMWSVIDEAVRDHCAKAGDSAAILQCIDEVTAAEADGALTAQITYGMMDSLPFAEARLDEAQTKEVLAKLKEKVDAGLIQTSQRDAAAKALLGL